MDKPSNKNCSKIISIEIPRDHVDKWLITASGKETSMEKVTTRAPLRFLSKLSGRKKLKKP
jgi:hypothetical protein